jgi:hypothetical protein
MTLSPEDFEHLVADLLSCEWKVRIELFKSGKDKGIDLRNTRVLESPGITIVQCKRYAPHRFTELLRSVKSERQKVEALKPARYVLATSVPLSPDNKKVLMDVLAPWCLSTGDIYGATELNALLRRFSKVEKAHFKLWIGSTAVLERILHSRIFNVTQATVELVRSHLSRLVMHRGFDRALEILHQDHHVLIVGNPGIGKSTLAKMLLCHYLREGFEPICVTGNIDDAWSLVQVPSDDKRKFVVLYDDFLGRYRFESLHFGKNEEVSLFDFLDKVRRSPNIRFLLTTREYILADAQRMHGAFADRAKEILKYTLKLEDYSKAHRAKMLFNHLYFSDLPDSRLELLVKDKVYETIVDHEHFNPRNVETISKFANSRAMNDRDYLRFVRREFNNPATVWEQPFRQDISPIARIILMALWTFGEPVDLEALKKATKRLASAGEETEFEFQFTDALRQLDGNFISTDRYPGLMRKSDHFIVAQFSNPSIEEFIDGFLRSDISRIERLTKSIVCFRQVSELFTQTSGQKMPGLSPDFWKSLREAAALAEKISGGHLINYRPSGERVRRVWDVRSVDWPDQTRVRLQIEAQARLSDAISDELQRRVTTAEGWRLIIAGSQHDVFQGFHVKSLHAWVKKDSGWPRSTINTCQAALRRAVFLSLTDEDDPWTGSIDSLRTLAEVVVSSGSSLTDEEKKAFHEAGKFAAEALAENAETADEVQNEVSELERLAKICGLDFRQEIAELESTADDLEGRGLSDNSYDPESTHVSQPDAEEELDIDALFAGLLDK